MLQSNRRNIAGSIIGKRFYSLTVVETKTEFHNTRRRRVCVCQCDCGNIIRARFDHIQSGNTQSCGCHRVRHGQSVQRTLTYISFSKAKERCNNPREIGYKNYGGRGVEFRFVSFEDFFAEVGERPSQEYTLDRIDANGHYEKGNVRWATRKEQASNKRKLI